MGEFFGDTVVPVTYPNGSGAEFSAVHEVLKGEGPRADEFREKLEERVAESDDTILEAYLDTGEISSEDLRKHLPSAVARGKVVPMCVLNPRESLGLEPLCEAIEERQITQFEEQYQIFLGLALLLLMAELVISERKRTREAWLGRFE